MRRIEGTVRAYRPISVRKVQFEFDGGSELIDLHSEYPWVLRDGDRVVVVGEDDGRSGLFHGYAYRNETRQARGRTDPGFADAIRYILLGVLFSWAIFPLFIHVPYGWRLFTYGRKVERAAAML